MQPAAPRFPVQPVLLAIGFLLLVGIGMSTLWLARQSSEDASSVFRTVSVQEKLSTLLLNVRRAESGQRGYLLTGRQAYLSDYSGAAPTIETFLAELRALLGENPERGPILDQMAELVRAKMAELQRTIDLRNAGKRERRLHLCKRMKALTAWRSCGVSLSWCWLMSSGYSVSVLKPPGRQTFACLQSPSSEWHWWS